MKAVAVLQPVARETYAALASVCALIWLLVSYFNKIDDNSAATKKLEQKLDQVEQKVEQKLDQVLASTQASSKENADAVRTAVELVRAEARADREFFFGRQPAARTQTSP